MIITRPSMFPQFENKEQNTYWRFRGEGKYLPEIISIQYCTNQ